MLLMCTLVYAFFALIDLVPMVKNKRWKVLAVYGVLIVTAYVLSVLTELGIEVPSPAVPIKRIITAIIGTQN